MRQRIWGILITLLLISGSALAQGKGESNPPAGTGGDLPPNSDALVAALAQGNRTFDLGAVVLDESFDAPDVWETYDDEGGTLSIRNSQYVIFAQSDSQIMWGQNQTPHRDVVIQAEAAPLSAELNNGYGVMCRADPANTMDGYHFWISGDGYAAIVASIDGNPDYLVEWEANENINQGQTLNQITAVCVEDYLALYVNGALLLETNDSTFKQGVAGMSAIGFVEGVSTEVAFNRLVIWETAGAGKSPRDLRGLASSEAALLPEVNRILQQSSQPVAAQALLLNEEFDADDAWEVYSDESSSLQIVDGRYVITQSTNNVMWGQNREVHSDVVLQVDTVQRSSELNNGYGLMCRADPENTVDGYHFYISGDGYYSILLFENQDSTALVDWTRSDGINLGQERNTLTAACVGDHLSFYVNGTLLAEVRDTTYSEGVTGMAAVTFVDGAPAEITFDNLRIWTVAR